MVNKDIIKGLNYFKKNLNSGETLKKKINFILISIQYLLRNKKLYGYPIKLTIDPINMCNLRCKVCPTGQNMPGRTRTKMSFELYKKILDEVGPYLIQLNLFNWGEPFMNENIFKMIRYAKKYKINVLISANINYFNDQICKEIVNSGLDELEISLDGTSQKTASKYQQGINFKKSIENMKKVIDYKKKKNSKKPHIKWFFLVNKYSEPEIENAKELAKKIGVDELEFGKFRCNMEDEIFLDNKQQYEKAKEWLPKNEEFSMYDYKKKEKKIKKKICKRPWTESVINSNGSVSPCCAVFYEKFDFGNISKNSFKDIWNNKFYKDSRKVSNGKKIKNKNLICYICKINNAEI